MQGISLETPDRTQERRSRPIRVYGNPFNSYPFPAWAPGGIGVWVLKLCAAKTKDVDGGLGSVLLQYYRDRQREVLCYRLLEESCELSMGTATGVLQRLFPECCTDGLLHSTAVRDDGMSR